MNAPSFRLFRQRSAKQIRRGLFVFFSLLVLTVFAVAFIMPIVLTITNSLMTQVEITANYGKIFTNATSSSKTYIAERVTLKFIPDFVSFDQ